MRIRAWHRLAGAALGAFALGAQAAAQTSFTVTAEIVPGCAIAGSATAANLDLGVLSYGVYPAVHSGQIVASTDAGAGIPLRVECTPGLELHVAIDGGLHAAGGQRRLGLAGGGTFVAYSLFANAALSVPLPVGTSVALEVPASGSLDLPIYGAATLPGTGLAPGVYNDTLHVTLTW